MSLHISSNRAAGGLVAVVVAGGGLAASLGAGYTVAHAALSDGSAYVAKGTAVQHINAEAREPDATTRSPLGKNGDGLTVTALPGGGAAVVNQRTNTVSVVDGGTMTPTATIRAKGSTRPVVVIASGSRGWMIDHDGESVTPLVDGRPQAAIKIGGKPLDAAPGPDDSVIVLDESGVLRRVMPDRSVHRLDVDAGRGAALTRAGGHTYLVTAAGAVVQVDGDSPQTVGSVEGLGPGPDGRMLVGALASSGTHVLIVSTSLLALVDPGTGRGPLVNLHSEQDTLGRPVEYRDRVYVPDYTDHTVLVVDVDGASSRVRAPVKVPGDDPTFDLFVAGGKLWANDQHSQHLLLFDASGRHDIDKGPGDGTHSDKPKRSPKAPTRGTSPSPDPRSPTGPPHSTPRPVPSPPSHPQPVKQVVVPRIPPGTNYADACEQIKAAGLANCVPVSGASSDEGESGDVTRTIPDGGTKVPVTSTVTVQYVGRPQVPDLQQDQITPAEQCQAVVAANLRCEPRPAAQRATAYSQFGQVQSVEPQPGTDVDKGSTVQVFYYDSVPMPQENGQPGASACAALGQLTLALPADQGGIQHPKCSKVTGPQPTKDPGQGGKVYAQQPAAAAPVTVRTTIKLTVYAGSFDLPDYAGQPGSDGEGVTQDQALADCNKYFRCDPVAGPPAIADHAKAGRVQSSDPGPGRHDAGSVVHLHIWQGTNTVPNVGNQTPDQACATLAAQGFQCNKAADANPDPTGNIITAEDPTGSQPLGAVVNVHYWPHTLVNLYRWTKAGDQRIFLRVEGAAGPGNGFTQTGGPVARVYPPGTLNQNWHLKEFDWNTCNGKSIPANVLYSHGAPDGCAHNGYTGSVADLVYPGANNVCWPGSVWLHRISTPVKDRYDVALGTANSADGTNPPTQGYDERLGCVYPPA